MPGRILAIGGDGSAFEPLLLELTGVARPRVLFVPTAKAHDPSIVEAFYDAFRAYDCVPSHLELFGTPERPAELADLEARPQRFQVIEPDVRALKRYIEQAA